MTSQIPARRAIVIAVQQPLDQSLPTRPAVTAAARRIALRLERGGYVVRLLVDDAAHDAERPLLANILDACDWLANAEAPLAVISAGVEDGALIPRDARAGRPRTWLPLAELFAELPAGAGVLFDGPLAEDAAEPLGWCLAAGRPGTRIPTAGDGPSRFLQATTLALGNTADGLTGEGFVTAVLDHAGQAAWRRGDAPAQLLRPVSESVRTCHACGASVTETRATFCPSCGAPLDVSELLDNGRYRLIKRLGAGGMGQVFLAEDTRLKVNRALKLLALPSDLTASESDSLRARMIQEARAAQTLANFTHHVVRVFDVGFAAERGEPYLVMELLDGETLTARIARGRLPFQEAMRIARVLAGALAEAHTRGFVHRDLKPDNIMLCRRGDETDHVKILDFGLVKAEQAEVKTESGHMMGTLQYMPPEQLRGQHVDARADVFSLAAVLYECFSGQRANPGKTQHQIFGVLLDRGIPSLGVVAPDLPEALVSLIDRCLRLDRAKRPADAGEVLAELAAVASKGAGRTPSGFDETVYGAAAVGPPSSETPSLARGEVSLRDSVAPSPPPTKWWILGLVPVLALGAWLALRDPPSDVTQAGSAGSAVVRPASDPVTPPSAAARTASPPSVTPPSAPQTAAARPLGPPQGPLPAVGAVTRTALAGGGTRYQGDHTRVRAAIAAEHALADPGVWDTLDVATRAVLARGVAWDELRVEPDGVRAPAPPKARRQAVKRAPVATFLTRPGAPPIVTGRSCRGLEKGDRVLTARYEILGYDDDDCRAAGCVAMVARGLQKARKMGERVIFTFDVARGDDDTQTTVGCTVRR